MKTWIIVALIVVGLVAWTMKKQQNGITKALECDGCDEETKELVEKAAATTQLNDLGAVGIEEPVQIRKNVVRGLLLTRGSSDRGLTDRLHSVNPNNFLSGRSTKESIAAAVENYKASDGLMIAQSELFEAALDGSLTGL
jgi:hypothetical protein